MFSCRSLSFMLPVFFSGFLLFAVFILFFLSSLQWSELALDERVFYLSVSRWFFLLILEALCGLNCPHCPHMTFACPVFIPFFVGVSLFGSFFSDSNLVVCPCWLSPFFPFLKAVRLWKILSVPLFFIFEKSGYPGWVAIIGFSGNWRGELY